MSVQKLLLRSSVIAALGGAATAAIPYIDLIPPQPVSEIELVVLTPEPTPQPVAGIDQSAWGLPCGLSVTATPLPEAMVALDVMDPCRPDTRVEITHMALRLSARTDAMGLLTLDIPALESPARFAVTLGTGATTRVETPLPDLADYTRAAITWTGPHSIGLQGQPAQPGEESIALSLLGDRTLEDPHLAQVLTTPVALEEYLLVNAEIAVDATSCGQRVVAQSLHSRGGGPVHVTDIALTLPGCEATGEFLMLQNLFQPPRLAPN
jgi:hypothetical protein